MSKVNNELVGTAGAALLAQIESGELYIPYKRGGTTFEGGMDCQTLAEHLLMVAGVSSTECDLSGSNAHYRACVWLGTPEECVEQFGEVPVGAAVFIVAEVSSSTPEKYRYDGLKDAEHMGVVLDGCAIHASASRGCVARSKFEGRTIPNGGWNMVGLFPWVEYALDTDISKSACAAGEITSVDAEGRGVMQEDAEIPVYDSMEEAQADVPVSASAYVKYVRIVSPDENPVKIREQPKKSAIYKYTAKHGTMCAYQGEKDGFYKILFNGKSRYVMCEFGQIVKVRKA